MAMLRRLTHAGERIRAWSAEPGAVSLIGGFPGSAAEAVKVGIIVKRARISQSNWKARYFVLTDNQLIYFKDEVSAPRLPRGQILLTEETTVTQVDDPTREHTVFVVETPGEPELRLESPHAREWMEAIEEVVHSLETVLRGYMWVRDKNDWENRYVIVHRTCVTMHEDHLNTSKLEACVDLTQPKVDVVEYDGRVFALQENGEDRLVIKARSDLELERWASEIRSKLSQGDPSMRHRTNTVT